MNCFSRLKWNKIAILLFFTLAFQATANSWRTGKVATLASSYDGVTITFTLKDLSPDSAPIDYTKCTCNSSWTHLCLNPQRANSDKEYAMLLSAYTAGKDVSVIFNDEICYIDAIYVLAE